MHGGTGYMGADYASHCGCNIAAPVRPGMGAGLYLAGRQGGMDGIYAGEPPPVHAFLIASGADP